MTRLVKAYTKTTMSWYKKFRSIMKSNFIGDSHALSCALVYPHALTNAPIRLNGLPLDPLCPYAHLCVPRASMRSHALQHAPYSGRPGTIFWGPGLKMTGPPGRVPGLNLTSHFWAGFRQFLTILRSISAYFRAFYSILVFKSLSRVDLHAWIRYFKLFFFHM